MARTLVKEIRDTRKQYVINGNFDIWQRTTSATVSGTGTQSSYVADRYRAIIVGSTSKSITVSRESSVLPTVVQSGYNSTYCCKFVNNTIVASLGTDNLCSPFSYIIEGNFYKELHGGLPITLSFWFKTSVIGTYSVAFKNQGGTRNYIVNFTVSDTNWNKYSISLNTDTTGTWIFDTGQGLRFDIAAVGGSNFQGTPGSWITGADHFCTSSTTNYLSSSSIMYVSQIKLNIGNTAAPFSLYGSNYSEEFLACQRYYETRGNSGGNYTLGRDYNFSGSTNTMIPYRTFMVTKRITPTSVTVWYDISDAATQNMSANGEVNTYGFTYLVNVPAGGFIDTKQYVADADF